MRVAFVIDSASDLLPAEAAQWGVVRLPMKVVFGHAEYADGVDLTQEAFFEKLRSCKQLPTTCQVPPSEFAQAYDSLLAQGHSVVVITISSRLSGTYQSAMIAAEGLEERVFVVDSLNATVGQRILLQRAMELAKQGLDARQIASRLEQEKTRIRLVAVLDSLEYLKKGGRISAATALAGGLLSIKPVVEVKDGAVVMAGTARGRKKANQMLCKLVNDYGMDPEKPAAFANAGEDRSLLLQFMEEAADLWQGRELPVCGLGSTIGTHVGPGAYGVAFFEKEQTEPAPREK